MTSRTGESDRDQQHSAERQRTEDWTNPHWVLSLMHFPANTPEHLERREQYCAIRVAQTTKSVGLHETVPSAVLNAAADGLSAALHTTAKRGIVAGDILAVLYALAESPWKIAEPSMGKAIHVIGKFATIERYPDQSSLPRSDREIRSCINDFRPVAHLWGAFRLHHEYPMRPHRDLFASAEGLRDFLGIARTLQAFGMAFIPKHGEQRPVFTPEQIWRVPNDDGRMLKPPWPDEMPLWLAGTIKSYTPRNRA